MCRKGILSDYYYFMLNSPTIVKQSKLYLAAGAVLCCLVIIAEKRAEMLRLAKEISEPPQRPEQYIITSQLGNV